jgi:solute carrier family 50 protein (sugar transporter)
VLKSILFVFFNFNSSHCGAGLGWVAYAVVKQDLFVLFSNAPGFVLSIWLNMGAAKLQYQEMLRSYNVGSNESHSLQLEENIDGEYFDDDGSTNRTHRGTEGEGSIPSFTSHEKWVIRVIIIWALVLSFVCFAPMSAEKQAALIGLVVNINLVVFYGAPLSTILEVMKTRNSSSIHRRTMGKSFVLDKNDESINYCTYQYFKSSLTGYSCSY